MRTSRNRVDDRKVRLALKQPDFIVMFCVILLVLFGIVMIFSASYNYSLENYHNMYYVFKKQCMWALVGLFVMILFMNYNYKKFMKYSIVLYVTANIFLILVLIISKSVKGAKRWIGVGGINFQPSEFAKIAVILFLATIVAANYKKFKNFGTFFIYLMFLVATTGLIAVENVSTSIVVMSIGLIMAFIAGTRVIYFSILCIPVSIFGLIFATMPHFAQRFSRIKFWINPWIDPSGGGFQTIQSLYALGSGGIFGLGLGQSRQKLGFLPEPHNDMIFSIICEELGLVGGIALLFIFLILIWRGIKIAMNAPDIFGCLVATGITSLISLQLLINVAVVTNTIPNTGMPLPFISYGGSSLIFTLISMGILLNISRYKKVD